MAQKSTKNPKFKLRKHVGRPTAFQTDYSDQARKLCLLGATDKDIADFFEVAKSTINLWKIQFLEFSESLRTGKIKADAEVAATMHSRA